MVSRTCFNMTPCHVPWKLKLVEKLKSCSRRAAAEKLQIRTGLVSSGSQHSKDLQSNQRHSKPRWGTVVPWVWNAGLLQACKCHTTCTVVQWMWKIHKMQSMGAFPSSHQQRMVPGNFDLVDFRLAHTMPVPWHCDPLLHVHLKEKKQCVWTCFVSRSVANWTCHIIRPRPCTSWPCPQAIGAQPTHTWSHRTIGTARQPQSLWLRAASP